MFDTDVFAKGGPVMYVLLGLSVYGLAVILYKAHQFITSGVFRTRFMEPVLMLIKQGDMEGAVNRLAAERGPVARIMRVAVQCGMDRDMPAKNREAEIARVGAGEMQYLESHLRGLEMISQVAPLLGLLGTVTGMVQAFSKFSQAGVRVDPSMLAGGIWEALICTAGGLMVAIPAVATHYVFDGLIERVRASMKDVTVQILSMLGHEMVQEAQEKEVIVREVVREVPVRETSVRESSSREARDYRAGSNARDPYPAEYDRQRQELVDRESATRRAAEEQEKAVEAYRGAHKGSDTLRLLNPSYRKFG